MNAIIMAAGMSSRFVPLCWEYPKALLKVKGEILIERQIRQLKEAMVEDITVVTGYKSEMFDYLKDKYKVSLVNNPDYNRYNNTSTLMCVLDRLQNTWLCSSDNYFTENVFMEHPSQAQYSAEWADGNTDEYCLLGDDNDNIIGVSVGGSNAWYMIGHVFFSKCFSDKFKKILVEDYERSETKQGYWEDVYINHIKELPLMKIKKNVPGIIHEFDSLEELRNFDNSYISNTRSEVLRSVCRRLKCEQGEIKNIHKYSNRDYRYSFAFDFAEQSYGYLANNLKEHFEIIKI